MNRYIKFKHFVICLVKWWKSLRTSTKTIFFLYFLSYFKLYGRTIPEPIKRQIWVDFPSKI